MNLADERHRQRVLDAAESQDCTLYRPDEEDSEAEEKDLGDAKVLFTGPFEPPQEWDAHEREAYFDGNDPALFVTALIACEAKPGSRAFFTAQPGDYLAATPGLGEVVMYYVCERLDDDQGTTYVLIRDEESA
ncbi:hypothetical protein [Phytopseudomonas dryadis]|uniref:Uncharacterized protein n=1 Tax=Phytopseudomonas dryadis TaxID=2487520 RepID=A0A4Q9QW52_9GAMM|nr:MULTISPECIES: hypothetical protein [Pseudomonas]TBU88149.1 hypothetical protein DNK44_18990 [Pseudomonas dryadis]TBV05401.1 hypothetical protein DNK34_12725 [Pseudomonas dryadis]TBV18410.1 hypothetical protein DNK41_08515 [Pseudomonas sp. FRB 230]